MMSHRLVYVSIIIVFIFAVGVRLFRLGDPLVIGGPSRQVQTADITRNLYRSGVREIFLPKVSYLGKEKVNFVVEFPIYNIVVATLYWFTGGVHESLGRFVSFLSWVVFSGCFFLFVRRYTSNTIALLALLFSAFIPIHVLMSRNFQPDEMMFAFLMASLYLIERGLRKNNYLILFLATISYAMALLMKPTALSALFPLTILFLQKDGRRFFFRPKFLSFLLLTSMPFLLWRWYASRPEINSYLLESARRVSEWFDFKLFLTFDYYRAIFNLEYTNVMTSVGLLLSAIGFFIMFSKSKNRALFLSWIFGCIFVLALFQKHSMTHSYYHLITVPIASFLMAVSYHSILGLVTRQSRYRILFQSILILLIPVYFAPIISSSVFDLPKKYAYVVEAAEKVREITPNGAVIIGAAGTGPAMVYFADRPGWSFIIDRSTLLEDTAFWSKNQPVEVDPIKELESLRQLGAEYFVASNRAELESNQRLFSYMRENYPFVIDNPRFAIFLLKGTT